MKIINCNVNGLLACMSKGSFGTFANLKPGIICCQEIKTHEQPEVLPGYLHFLTAKPAKRVRRGSHHDFAGANVYSQRGE